MLLDPCNPCCLGCLVCKGGIGTKIFRLSLQGFVSVPDPVGEEESPYYQIINAEDLNTELLIGNEDFVFTAGMLGETWTGVAGSDEHDGCSRSTAQDWVGLHELILVTWSKSGDDWINDSEDYGEQGGQIVYLNALYAAVWLDETDGTWGFFFGTIAGNSLVPIEETTDGQFECEGYQGELEGVTDWEMNGLDFSTVTATLEIEEPA